MSEAHPDVTGRLLALSPIDSRSRELSLGLKEQVLIGSDEALNDFVVSAATVSRRHASIMLRGEHFLVRDLNSTNGTFVNGRRIVAPTLMQNGDELRFGAVRFVFSSVEPTLPAEGTAAKMRTRPERRRSLSKRSLAEVVLVAFVLGFGLAQYLAYQIYHEGGGPLLASAVPVPRTQRVRKLIHAYPSDRASQPLAQDRQGLRQPSRNRGTTKPTQAGEAGAGLIPADEMPAIIEPGELRAAVALTSLFTSSGNFAGEPAPSFRLENLSGAAVSLSEFRGKVVLLNFWATWCSHCRDEMPSLARLSRELGEPKHFAVLTVSIDRGGAATVKPFVRENGYQFPVLLDPTGRVSAAYRVTGIPSTFLIGPAGRILWNCAGGIDWSNKEVRRALKEALDSSKAGAIKS